jgi:dTDP-4-amino-4,6-dideoxygalactose transaminase
VHIWDDGDVDCTMTPSGKDSTAALSCRPGAVGGVLPEVAEIAGLPSRRTIVEDTPPLPPTHVRYVEDKRIDWQRVEQITALSRQARQWTNFGPVSRALERALEHILRLPRERAVVMCASATVGLYVLAGLSAVRFGRPLRWVVCSYTFFSQRTGPFATAVVADCDERGLIDLDAVAAMPDGTWDGLVVTNLFAGLRNARVFADFCRTRGKALILDSAGALLGLDRGWRGHPDEAISFHHTKPWGVGEGGCVIVDRADAELARSALNFAIGGPPSLRSFAGNGKISDVACAAILERLERLPSWAPSYAAQRARIEALCDAAGVPRLLDAPRDAVLASVPVLAADPVARGDLAHSGFDAGKYYPPLDAGAHTAQRIFARILNIPAHGGMAAVETAALSEAVRMLSPNPAERGNERAERDAHGSDPT